jgi:hypothetical protein
LAIKEPLSRNISFSSLVSSITEPFREFFFHMVEFRLKRSLFLQIFLSLNGTQAITEPFSRTFLSLNGTEVVTEPCHGIILSLWDFGYHGAFSWNHSFTLGFRYRGAFSWNHSSLWDFGYHRAFSWNHSFTLGFRLSWSLLMESFFHFCIS